MASHSLDVLTRVRPVVPDALIARVEAWAAGNVAAEPRSSASVVLLRAVPDHGGPRLETYLMHRHARMAFAASMAVFPGGGVEPADGSDPHGAIRACAVRETLEETGVRLEPADLRPWAHWVTPEVEPRRYDTWFFLAALPSGQDARDLSGETERAGWMAPAEALAAAADGEVGLMPPTLSILTELAEAGSVDALLEAAVGRVVVTVEPRIERVAGAWTFVYPVTGRADTGDRDPDARGPGGPGAVGAGEAR